MKTFREFILEAEIKWNTGSLKGSGRSPAETAKQRKSQIERTARQKPSPEVFSRLTKIKKGISGSDTLSKDTDPKPEYVFDSIMDWTLSPDKIMSLMSFSFTGEGQITIKYP